MFCCLGRNPSKLFRIQGHFYIIAYNSPAFIFCRFFRQDFLSRIKNFRYHFFPHCHIKAADFRIDFHHAVITGSHVPPDGIPDGSRNFFRQQFGWNPFFFLHHGQSFKKLVVGIGRLLLLLSASHFPYFLQTLDN